MKRIVVTVSPDGSTKVETQGFAGSTCMDETRRLEEALGSNRKVVRTAEHYKASKRTTGGYRCES